jgi:hypothetical protein
MQSASSLKNSQVEESKASFFMFAPNRRGNKKQLRVNTSLVVLIRGIFSSLTPLARYLQCMSELIATLQRSYQRISCICELTKTKSNDCDVISLIELIKTTHPNVVKLPPPSPLLPAILINYNFLSGSISCAISQPNDVVKTQMGTEKKRKQ